MLSRNRILAHSLTVVLLAGGAALAPAAVLAQGDSARVTAQLATAAPQERVLAGGVLWRCEGTSCSASLAGKRPLRMCSDLKREVGQITRFDVGGAPLDEGQLARCNG